MTARVQSNQRDGLAFFGRMCASISHEIKNCLAVINEQNGLHEDLLMLQKQGRALAPERVERINKTIAEQVQRMDGIVKRLNHFAHSPDHVEEHIELSEMCSAVRELCNRFAANKGVVLTCEAPTSAAIKAQPFLVTQLLVQCLEALFEDITSGQTITMRVMENEHGPVVAIMPGLEHTPSSIHSLAKEVGACIQRHDRGMVITEIGFQTS
ncbi:MAG: hypothetical protein CSA21_06420 [Deltaproteobacteria bacterium]|nr:MAG: hypothetical protein CSA21_06420 [Deltaproteobacteria bacterium]